MSKKQEDLIIKNAYSSGTQEKESKGEPAEIYTFYTFYDKIIYQFDNHIFIKEARYGRRVE